MASGKGKPTDQLPGSSKEKSQASKLEEKIWGDLSTIDIRSTAVGLDYSEPPYEVPNSVSAVRSLVQRIQDILHNKYEFGQRLDEEDEEFMEWLLAFHHNLQLKLGDEGIHYIKVDRYVKEYGMRPTKCFHVVRKDGTSMDFSYRKCVGSLADKVPDNLPDVARKLQEEGPRPKTTRRSHFF